MADGEENDGNEPSPPIEDRDTSGDQYGGMNANRAWIFVPKWIG